MACISTVAFIMAITSSSVHTCSIFVVKFNFYIETGLEKNSSGEQMLCRILDTIIDQTLYLVINKTLCHKKF